MAKRRATKKRAVGQRAARQPAGRKLKAKNALLDTPAADETMACGNGMAHKSGTNGNATNGHAIDYHASNIPSADKDAMTTEREQTPSHGSETSASKRHSMSTIAEKVSQVSLDDFDDFDDTFAFNRYTELTRSPDHALDANLCDPVADGAHEHRTPKELEAAYALAILLPNSGPCKRRSERIKKLTKKAEVAKAQKSKTQAPVCKANASKAKARRAKSKQKHAHRFIFSLKRQLKQEDADGADGFNFRSDKDMIVKCFVSAETAEKISDCLVADVLVNMATSG